MQTQPDPKIAPRDGEPHPGASQEGQRLAAASPRAKARVASLAYWLYFLALAGGGLLIEGLIVCLASTKQDSCCLTGESYQDRRGCLMGNLTPRKFWLQPPPQAFPGV